MEDKLLFEDKIIVSHESSNDNKFKVKVKWTGACKLPHANFMIGLYCHKRQMDKNFCAFVKLENEKSDYEFPIVVPKGYYDIRICTWSGLIIYDYKSIYQVEKYFVNDTEEEFSVTVEWKKDEKELFVKLKKPAEDGDYIGLFEHDTLSMKDGYMKGLKTTLFGVDVLERFFDVDVNQLGDTVGKKYEVRYFRKDCVVTNLADHSTIPYAFSNIFEISL
ncbi:Fibronectin type-III domain-containing protein [Entamoeba marina]